MKRSKALTKIGLTIAQFLHKYQITGFSIEKIDNLSESILSILEKEIGMPPPYHPTKGYEAAESHGTGTLTYYRKKLREWEPEDEKK